MFRKPTEYFSMLKSNQQVKVKVKPSQKSKRGQEPLRPRWATYEMFKWFLNAQKMCLVCQAEHSCCTEPPAHCTADIMIRYSCTSVGLPVKTLLILDKIETFTLFNSAVQLFESSLAHFCWQSSVDPQMSKTAQLYVTPEAQIRHRHCTVTTTGAHWYHRV